MQRSTRCIFHSDVRCCRHQSASGRRAGHPPRHTPQAVPAFQRPASFAQSKYERKHRQQLNAITAHGRAPSRHCACLNKSWLTHPAAADIPPDRSRTLHSTVAPCKRRSARVPVHRLGSQAIPSAPRHMPRRTQHHSMCVAVGLPHLPQALEQTPPSACHRGMPNGPPWRQSGACTQANPDSQSPSGRGLA